MFYNVPIVSFKSASLNKFLASSSLLYKKFNFIIISVDCNTTNIIKFIGFCIKSWQPLETSRWNLKFRLRKYHKWEITSPSVLLTSIPSGTSFNQILAFIIYTKNHLRKLEGIFVAIIKNNSNNYYHLWSSSIFLNVNYHPN